MLIRKCAMITVIAVLSIMAFFKLVRQDISASSVPKIDDFVYVYLPGNAWLDGQQPYLHKSVAEVSVRIYGVEAGEAFKELNVYYPPTTFFCALPFLLLPHQAIGVTTLLVSLGLYAWMVWLLAADLKGIPRYLFFAFAANYAPLHSGLRPRNITIVLAALILIPLLKAARDRMSSPWWFVLLGIGVGIKPQIGICFLLILLAAREWKRFSIAFSTVAASVAISVGWLAVHGVHWLVPLLNTLHQGPTATSQIGRNTTSFVFNGVANFRLINLSPVIYLLTGNPRLSSTLPLLLAGVPFLGLAVYLWRHPERRFGSSQEWLPVFGLLGAISLLPAYSRYYGALLILPLFAWLWTQWSRPLMRGFVLIGVVLFSLPMPQFPVIFQAAVDYLHHPGFGLLQATRIVTEEYFAAFRPAFWQELVCALPNLYLLAVCLFIPQMIMRQTTPVEMRADTFAD